MVYRDWIHEFSILLFHLLKFHELLLLFFNALFSECTLFLLGPWLAVLFLCPLHRETVRPVARSWRTVGGMNNPMVLFLFMRSFTDLLTKSPRIVLEWNHKTPFQVVSSWNRYWLIPRVFLFLRMQQVKIIFICLDFGLKLCYQLVKTAHSVYIRNCRMIGRLVVIRIICLLFFHR